MSYGSLFYNSNGDLIFDGVDCLYLNGSGNCTKFAFGTGTALYKNKSAINSNAGANSVGQWTWGQAGYPSGTNYYYVYQSVVSATTLYSAMYVYPWTVFNSSLGINELPFVKIPSAGILQMEHLNSALPDFIQGANFVVATSDAAALEYKIFSPTISASTETYGMQIYSDTGAVVFDSRSPILGVEVFQITLGQVQNILLNDAVVDLTLSKSIPSAFVHSPDWMTYTSHTTSSGCGRFIKITQPSSTTIRLSRQSIGPNLGLCNNGYNNFQPLTLFVSR